MRSSLVLLLSLGAVAGYMLPLAAPTASRHAAAARTARPAFMNEIDEEPSDMEPDEFEAEVYTEEEVLAESTSPPPQVGDPAAEAALREKLLRLGASTKRGEASSEQEKTNGRMWVAELEKLNPAAAPARECEGTWELIWSDTQLFRSSPFFMAGRAVCADGAEARRYDAFCDLHRAALAISEIGKVRQVVSLDPPRLTSEFEVRAGALPFLSDYTPFGYSGGLPLAIEGAIVSTASIEDVDSGAWSLFMDTVEIKGSNVPGLRQLLDGGVKLESRLLGDALESQFGESLGYANPRPRFEVTYLGGEMRVSRDQDGKTFVYVKTSASKEPSDYATVSADLGIPALINSLSQIWGN